MTRRASLPGADELFRANTPALSAVRQVVEEAQEVSKAIGVAPTNPKTKKGVRSTPRRRVTTVDRSPSGREKHDEKITVYLSPDELLISIKHDLLYVEILVLL